MIIKLALLSIIIVSCGPKEVQFPEGREAISPYQVTNAEKMQNDQEGIFTKAATLNTTMIKTGNSSYPFSEYSSHQALTYYANKPLGSSSPIRFRGEIAKGKLVIETIQDK